MLTTADYLNLSDQAYKVGYINKYNLPTGYVLLATSAQLFQTGSGGYQGYAIYNPQLKHLVITSSGTSIDNLRSDSLDFMLDLVSDINIVDHSIPDQFTYAKRLLDAAQSNTYVMGQNYKLTFTGHSLGATMAELLTAETLSKGINANAITFDGPGSKPLIIKQWGHQLANVVHNKVITYNGSPNMVNTLNKQIGQIHQLEYHGKNKWINLFQSDSYKQVHKYITNEFPHFSKFTSATFLYAPHKMDIFKSEINNKTGEFLAEKYVSDWNTLHQRSELAKFIIQDENIQSLIMLSNSATKIEETVKILQIASEAAPLISEVLEEVNELVSSFLDAFLTNNFMHG